MLFYLLLAFGFSNNFKINKMEKLKVESITLDSDGVLKVVTNIKDNLQLAKHVNKDRMEKCLNDHICELHCYYSDDMISNITYEGRYFPFKAREFIDFLKEKKNKERSLS